MTSFATLAHANGAGDFEDWWQQSLQDGVITGSAVGKDFAVGAELPQVRRRRTPATALS